MHDPMVVAFEVVTPIPKRERWKDARLAKPTGLVRRRRTNQENLGEPVYPWWRPAGWEGAVRGRAFGLYQAATVWHVEPNGADAFTVCKHDTRWKWHVRHWRVQIHLAQKFHRFMFERCTECGRRYPWGYAPISHSWDEPRGPWFKVTRRSYHHECSSLVHVRRELEEARQFIVDPDAMDNNARWRVGYAIDSRLGLRDES